MFCFRLQNDTNLSLRHIPKCQYISTKVHVFITQKTEVYSLLVGWGPWTIIYAKGKELRI